MQTEERDLQQGTKKFALSVVRMFSALPKTTEARVLGKQLLGSGTSLEQIIARHIALGVLIHTS